MYMCARELYRYVSQCKAIDWTDSFHCRVSRLFIREINKAHIPLCLWMCVFLSFSVCCALCLRFSFIKYEGMRMRTSWQFLWCENIIDMGQLSNHIARACQPGQRLFHASLYSEWNVLWVESAPELWRTKPTENGNFLPRLGLGTFH